VLPVFPADSGDNGRRSVKRTFDGGHRRSPRKQKIPHSPPGD
jgi:hypothetical protein